ICSRAIRLQPSSKGSASLKRKAMRTLVLRPGEIRDGLEYCYRHLKLAAAQAQARTLRHCRPFLKLQLIYGRTPTLGRACPAQASHARIRASGSAAVIKSVITATDCAPAAMTLGAHSSVMPPMATSGIAPISSFQREMAAKPCGAHAIALSLVA